MGASENVRSLYFPFALRHLHCHTMGGRRRGSCDWSGQLQLVSLSVSALANSWRPLSAEGDRAARGQGPRGKGQGAWGKGSGA